MGDWIAFWNSKHAVYVNARHRDVHYRRVAQDILVHVGAGARILDYGCGEALHADLIAAPAAQLTLCETASSLRAELSRSFSSNPRILVRSTEDVAKLPDGSFDLVIMHSVAQSRRRSSMACSPFFTDCSRRTVSSFSVISCRRISVPRPTRLPCCASH